MAPKDEVYWYSLLKPRFTSLNTNISVDLAIVGGGMAGLMCAQAARAKGLAVAIIEAEFCGAGASGKSSGFITPDSELELSDLIANYGEPSARELWEFVVSGCEAIRKNILDYRLDCDYQIQDSLFVANSQSGRKKVRHEYAARQKLNYSSTIYEAADLPRVLGSQEYYGAVRYPGTFGIISYLYCQGLKDVLVKDGVQVYERSPVRKVDNQAVWTGEHKVTTKNVVLCTDRFLPELGVVPQDVYHAQTFLGLSRPLTAEQQHQLFPSDHLMVWDTDVTYQYFRLTGEGRLLLGGASVLFTYLRQEKHSSRFIINKLQKYLHDKFPNLKIELEYLWPGLIGISKDFLPVAGLHQQWPNVYYIGGAAGLPWAAALGQYVAQKIVNPAANQFDKYFATPRKYPVGYSLQKALGKPITFAISHGITKYFK